jgi:hypothetical protein
MARDTQSEKKTTDTVQAHEPAQPLYRYQADDSRAPSVNFDGAAKNAAGAQGSSSTGNVRFA